jgi:non-specific serine/threonine protein kinase
MRIYAKAQRLTPDDPINDAGSADGSESATKPPDHATPEMPNLQPGSAEWFKSASPPPMPTSIGRFKVLRRLGAGGMGEVFLGVDPKIKREVAIKALPPKHAQDKRWRDRLANEAERLGAINHPNIAGIYERLDIEDGSSYLIMEYVEGRTLRELLWTGPLRLKDTLNWCAQVALALEAPHNRSIIHRDIKPENLMVRPDGVVKVLDFGLAMDASPPPVAVRASAPTRVDPLPQSTWREIRARQAAGAKPAAPTHPGHANEGMVGTPGYMSPEQARCRAVTRQTDIFSFGCVLFECLTGQFAFPGASEADRIAATLNDDPEWDLLPASLPTNLCDLLRHCLEKPVSDRLRDIADAKYVLDSVAGKRSTPVRSKPAIPTPHNLPIQMQSFVGRSEAIERLTRLLPTSRLLTIVGAGGCGKTSLAVRVASMVLEDFPTGVWLAELAGLEVAERIPETLAAILGIKVDPTVGAKEAISQHFGNRPALIVLDNCEHLLPGLAGVLAGILRSCSHLRVIATSREVLKIPGEQVFILQPLPIPGDVATGVDAETKENESVRLFVERARLVRPNFDPKGASLAAVARICQRLDGIPLAIELAAARIKMLTPEQIEDRLKDPLPFLVGGTSPAGPRHATMTAVLDWSYRPLRNEDRLALHKLEVFVGGFGIEAAQAVLNVRDETCLDLLTGLVDKSLLVAEMSDDSLDGSSEARYRLLESVRDYIQALRTRRRRAPERSAAAVESESEKLSAEVEAIAAGVRPHLDWADLCNLHLAYYDRLATRIEEGLKRGDPTARRMGLRERANLNAALRHALGPNHPGSTGYPYASLLNRIWPMLLAPPGG